MSNETVCRGCGKPILWITVGTKKIPLDLKPIIYVYDESRHEANAHWKQVDQGKAGVSHFITCPKANDFSGSNKDKPPTTSAAPASAGGALDSASTVAFLRAIDCSTEIEPTDWEKGFIEDKLQRAARFGDANVRFTGGAVGVIEKMMSRYRDQLGGIVTQKPAPKPGKKPEPQPQPAEAEEAPAATDGEDNLPF